MNSRTVKIPVLNLDSPQIKTIEYIFTITLNGYLKKKRNSTQLEKKPDLSHRRYFRLTYWNSEKSDIEVRLATLIISKISKREKIIKNKY